MSTMNLEYVLQSTPTVRSLVQHDPVFAQELYRALCNNKFFHIRETPEDSWSCTWRYAASLVSELSANTTDAYYCSGDEGVISPRVADVLAQLGWQGEPMSDYF